MCVYVVVAYPSPLVLQSSLPTYVCSFATATTDAVPCIPSLTMVRSPVPRVLWSPSSAVVTRGAGTNSSSSRSASELAVPSSHVAPSVSRTRTFSDDCDSQPQSTVQLYDDGRLSASQQRTDSVSSTSTEDLVSRLVATLPADIVKSLLVSNSSQQTIEMLTETLNMIQSAGVVPLDTDAMRKLSNSAQLDSMVRELLCKSRFEAAMTEPALGRWKSLPGLLQQTEYKTAALSNPRDCVKGKLDVSGCKGVRRSLGQLGHAPADQLQDQASDQHWYVFCMKIFTYWYQLNVLPACEHVGYLAGRSRLVSLAKL